MATLFQSIVILNALFFLIYGLQCMISQTMVSEFRRFRLPDSLRILTGILQLLGSLGIVAGLYFSVIGSLASGGLALMMLVAFITRIRVGDGVLKSAPSLIFLVINAWLSYTFYILPRATFDITATL